MRSLDRLARTTLAIIVSAAGAVTAEAQSQPPAGDAPGSNLRLSGSVFGGYDSDITVGALGGVQPSAALGGGSLTLNYRVRSEKIGFATRGTADSRYYHADKPLKATTFTGLAVFGVQATSRVKIDASVSSMYSPQFVFAPFPVSDTPEEPPPPVLDQSVSAYDMVTVTGNVSASANLTRRSSVNFTYGAAQYRYVVDDTQTTYFNVGGGYSYNISRYASLRLGYHEVKANYPTFLEPSLSALRQRSWNAGVNYSRPLSASRRTTVSFGSGSSAVENSQETFYTVTGNAGLQHQIRRTWKLNVLYTRGLGVVAGFVEPIFSDGVSVNLRGDLARRVGLMTNTGFTNGDVGLGSRAQDYRSFQSSTRLEWALTERIGVFGSYSYYQYAFEVSARIPGVPSELGRHSGRIGMIFRVPIVQERTSRRAAR